MKLFPYCRFYDVADRFDEAAKARDLSGMLEQVDCATAFIENEQYPEGDREYARSTVQSMRQAIADLKERRRSLMLACGETYIFAV